MKCMGVDLGRRRIGLALGESEVRMAWPLKTVEVEGDPFFAMEEIVQTVHENEVRFVAVGLPLNMDGSIGPSAKTALRWKKAFEKRVSCRVELSDERLTTVETHKELTSLGIRAKRHIKVADQLSAVMILQSAMEREERRESAAAGE